jgi:DNA transformation protein
MSNAQSFVEHALDLLSLLGVPIQARSMFGGHGLYARGVMFGLLDDDELFLKTDPETRPRFLAADCRMWQYPGSDETSYYRPPDEAHEDAEAMRPWAALGLEAAMRLKAAKDAKARATAERRKAREDAKAAAERLPKGKKATKKAQARKPQASLARASTGSARADSRRRSPAPADSRRRKR